MINNRLYDGAENYHIFIKAGFRKGMSTTDNIYNYYYYYFTWSNIAYYKSEEKLFYAFIVFTWLLAMW